MVGNWVGAAVVSLGLALWVAQPVAAKTPIYRCDVMKKRISDEVADTEMFTRLVYTRQDKHFYEVNNIVGIEILVRCDEGRFTNLDARLRQSGSLGGIDATNRQRWMALYAALARAFDPKMRGTEIVSKTDKMVSDATAEFKAKKDGGTKEPKGYAARAFGRYGMSSEIEEGRVALSAWLADDL